MARFDRAVILVTTVCDRSCAHCCYGIGANTALPPVHHTWPYFEDAARWLSGLAWLCVSGGEPTLHPEFPRIAREFRALFKPHKLALATNGAGVLQHHDVMGCFDEVRLTTFGAATDRAADDWLREHLPRRRFPQSPIHKPPPASPRSQAKACLRYEIAAYAAGRLWPCCVAPGVDGAASIVPGPAWRAQLATTPLPCARCAFTEAS